MTIAAVATPPGRGGIGVVRISGPDACAIAGRLTGRRDFEPRRAHLARFLDAEGEVLDQGIVLWFPAPGSYTGEDVVELQGHGSPVMLRALLARVFELGARPAEPGEFTRRAVENGRMDLSQAEAVAACIDAATERAGRLAQRQLAGAFGRRIQTLMDELTGVVAQLEACLDFPEEDLPPLYLEDLRSRLQSRLLEPIDAMLATAPVGERLFAGATVAILGQANVGKSSLLNRLAGRERAIVSDVPGTTRDLIEADFEIRGIPVRLVDTAGLRDRADIVEREGIRRALDAARCADLVLFVADAGRASTWECPSFDAPRVDLRVMNKIDAHPVHADEREDWLPVSARTGEGMEALIEAMAERLGDLPLHDEDAVVTRARHRRALERARSELLEGERMLTDESRLEVVADHWRRAWTDLGEILGLGDVEHILDRVFADFCIGK